MGSVNRPDVLAYNRAEDDLRRVHPGEFARLLNARRAELGLHPIPPSAGGPDARRVDVDEDLVKRAWLRGDSVESIAAVLGVHPNTVRNRAHRMGLRRAKGSNLGGRQAS